MLTIFAAGVTGGHDEARGTMYILVGKHTRCRSKGIRDMGIFAATLFNNQGFSAGVEYVAGSDEIGHSSIRIE